ncbi:hypothetical protein [Pseudoxanthomonas mexicana]|uniref:hypothetical protein n=1 Tax=Pseudoxanthomonas mexicana TaxID=128785 RepID=UPI0028A9543E|nr:hypothetical protein [Pseudoxanthomonas mexicana]
MEKDESSEPWQVMGIQRLLFTVAGIAGLTAMIVFIATSRFTGFGLIALTFVTGWAAACTVFVLGGLASMASYFLAEALTHFATEETKERIYLTLRWTALVGATTALLWTGARGFYDGMRNNRLESSQALYEQCMAPKWRTVTREWQECSDGWKSRSIGRRGACSHHGGVVWRTLQRREQHVPHSEAYCRTDSLARSWVD